MVQTSFMGATILFTKPESIILTIGLLAILGFIAYGIYKNKIKGA